jgi:hypothetical protein
MNSAKDGARRCPSSSGVCGPITIGAGAWGSAVSLALLAAGALELRDRWRAR